MTSIAVPLSDPFAAFVDEKVRSGEFQSHTEVVEQALSLLQTDEEKLKQLNDAIQLGLDDIAAGRYTEVDDVGAWIETLGNEED